MVEPIQFKSVKCIVELGPGTGIITHELLKNMPEDSILLAFEINKEFCDTLNQIGDKRLKVISDSAEKMEQYLKEYNVTQVDYVVSSLPLFMIPNEVVDKILEVTLKVLKKEGAYIQYQYSLNAYKKLRNTFKKVDLNFTPMNIPPAFVFTCTI